MRNADNREMERDHVYLVGIERFKPTFFEETVADQQDRKRQGRVAR